jgi:PPIC-type PPIASE domain
MRSPRIPLLILLCASSVFAQPGQANQDGQSAAPTLPKQGIATATTRHGGLEPRVDAKISPDAAVVMLEGPCDQPRKGTRQSDCKRLVTRAEIDSLLDLLEPNASPAARRQFAVNYARLVAASEAAKRRHLETDPAVAKQLLMQQKLVYMQVLANTLYRQIEAEASNVPTPEIEKYYSGHQLDFERGEVRRLVVPKQISTPGAQSLDASILKTKAEEFRTRAAAGEDFDKLQRAAYEDLGIKTTVSTTKLSMVRRMSLSVEESKVLDLDPGQVTQVLESPSAFVVVKLDSKKILSLEDAKPEIVPFLQRERAQQVIKEAGESGKAQFDLEYFGLASAPKLFPPPQVTGLAGESGTHSAFSQRIAARRPMIPRRPEATISPLTPR